MMSPRNSTNASLVWRGTVWPMISPVVVLSAASRQRAVPVVLKPVPLRAARRERQDGIQSIERLNRRFLIDGKDHRVLRWIEIQAEHVGGLLLEVRIVGEHVAFEPMRLQPGALPHQGDQHMADAEHHRELPRTPMRAPVRGALASLRENARFHGGRPHRRGLPAILGPETRQTIRLEPLFQRLT
jgi:hypothetical protein